MKLHIFNPEHEMALAANLDQFTSPRAGREMRSQLSFLPALWAEDGDFVLVDDVKKAQMSVSRLKCRCAEVQFVCPNEMPITMIDKVLPWGWNRSIVHQLKRLHVPTDLLPTEETLDFIREISHRRWASQNLLPAFRSLGEDVIGEAYYYSSFPNYICPVVIKSPWSCSGRGVRYALSEQQYMSHERWANNVINRQGGIMIEPYYSRIMDFAMEFESTANEIKYLGLSIFLTNKGGYTGNVLASEEYKLHVISQFVPLSILEEARGIIMREMEVLVSNKYQGFFGIDMMIVENKSKRKDTISYQLHPCVELNLRRTMGHVALAIKRNDDTPMMMGINYDGSYRFDILPIPQDLVDGFMK